jgi:hypothetical protein
MIPDGLMASASKSPEAQIFKVFCWIVTVLFHLWSAAVIFYCSFPKTPVLAAGFTIAYLCLVGAFLSARPKSLAFSLIGCVAVLLWFNSISLPQNAIYPDYLQMPYAEFNGNLVAIHKVRNNEYRTRKDFDVHYETRTYDMRQLQSLDLLVNYWGMAAISHTFLSFGFSDGRYLDVSVEIRPRVGQEYDMFRGFFKQYALIYIWADERDLIRKRTNYQGEDVYLYRYKIKPDDIRKLFIQMLKSTDQLYTHDEFYNTMTQSCTSAIDDDVNKSGIYKIHFYQRHLLTGDIDRRLYHYGVLETYGLSFPELRQRANIDQRAKDADQSPDFSDKIRTHLNSVLEKTP